MKNFLLLSTAAATAIALTTITSTPTLLAHGAAHRTHTHTHAPSEPPALDEAQGNPLLDALIEHYHPGERPWAAQLSTSFESRHIHMGITEADRSPVWGTELGLEWNRLALNASYFVALQNNWKEWNFSASWSLNFGPVFIVPGYNFRYSPYTHAHSETAEHEDHADSHTSGEHDHAHDEEHAHAHNDHPGHSHTHTKYGHELFVTAGISAIPYITPSAGFLWNLYDDGGGFLECRIDACFPIVKDTLFLEPYASLGLNFGYNTQDYYGWNNINYGSNLRWVLSEIISLSAGISQNIPLRAAQLAGSQPEAIATAGITFSF